MEYLEIMFRRTWAHKPEGIDTRCEVMQEKPRKPSTPDCERDTIQAVPSGPWHVHNPRGHSYTVTLSRECEPAAAIANVCRGSISAK